MDYVDQTNVVVRKDDVRLATNCLCVEFDNLKCMTRLKDKAKVLFRDGRHNRALVLYGRVLKVDANDGRRASPVRSILRQLSRSVMATFAIANLAGGRLHTVLHSKQSTCFLAMGRHNEAIRKSLHAIKIHPMYMKAILQCAKCHAMVGQLDCGRYVPLVKEGG